MSYQKISSTTTLPQLVVKCTEAYLYFIEQGFINNLKEHEQDFIINMFALIDAHDTTIDTICG